VNIEKQNKIEKFVASPETEVLGASLLALPVCLKADEILPVLAKHGFANIDPDKWYPQQNILQLYRDIVEGRTNVSENMVSIGIKSVDTMPFPQEVNTIEAALQMVISSYTPVHRNIQPGEGGVLMKISDNHYQILLNVPYPDDIFYGYYWGILKKYTPHEMRFRLAMEEPKGGEPGVLFDIRWGTDI
jgi:hypothetical protein